MHVLQIESVSKAFQNRKVVDEVSFKVHSGQIVGLLGPNGAGKTTSFYMVVGILRPDSGKILFDQISITTMPMHERARQGISYLAQEPSIFRKLSVRDNIMAVLENMDLSNEERDATVEKLMVDLNILHIAHSKGFQLSGGERRRVEIARALATKPDFMLLDEPFAGIDPISVVELQKIIKQLKEKGIGLLITDHNVRETLGICDLSYILKDGRVQEVGTAEELLKSKIARESYLGEGFRL